MLQSTLVPNNIDVQNNNAPHHGKMGNERSAIHPSTKEKMIKQEVTNNEENPNRLAPYQPTHASAQSVALSLLKLTSGDVFFDLGCGDGRLVLGAFEEFYKDRSTAPSSCVEDANAEGGVVEADDQHASEFHELGKGRDDATNPKSHIIIKELTEINQEMVVENEESAFGLGAGHNNDDDSLSECAGSSEERSEAETYDFEDYNDDDNILTASESGHILDVDDFPLSHASNGDQIDYSDKLDCKSTRDNATPKDKDGDSDKGNDGDHQQSPHARNPSQDHGSTITIPHLMRNSSYDSHGSNESNEMVSVEYQTNRNHLQCNSSHVGHHELLVGGVIGTGHNLGAGRRFSYNNAVHRGAPPMGQVIDESDGDDRFRKSCNGIFSAETLEAMSAVAPLSRMSNALTLSPAMEITPIICNRKVIPDHLRVDSLTSLGTPFGDVDDSDRHHIDGIIAKYNDVGSGHRTSLGNRLWNGISGCTSGDNDESIPPPPAIPRVNHSMSHINRTFTSSTGDNINDDEDVDYDKDDELLEFGRIYDIPATITASFSPMSGGTERKQDDSMKADLVNQLLDIPSHCHNCLLNPHPEHNLQGATSQAVSELKCVGIEYSTTHAELAVQNMKKLVAKLASNSPDRGSVLSKRVYIRCGDVLEEWTRGGEELPGEREQNNYTSEIKEDSCFEEDSSPTVRADDKCASELTLLNDATAVFVYLLPDGLKKVKPLLLEAARRHRHRVQGQRNQIMRQCQQEFIQQQRLVRNHQFHIPNSTENLTHRKGTYSHISDITDCDYQDITCTTGKYVRIQNIRGNSFDDDPENFPHLLHQDNETEADDMVVRVVRENDCCDKNEVEGETSPLRQCWNNEMDSIPKFRIVSYMFSIPGWKPAKVDRTSKGACPLYLYEDVDLLD